MREALETFFSGLFAIIFGVLWLQLFAAFWVPGGFSLLEAELRWVLGVASCAACVLLPMGAALLMFSFFCGFGRLVRARFLDAEAAEPALPRARVMRGPGRSRMVSFLSCTRGVGRAR